MERTEGASVIDIMNIGSFLEVLRIEIFLTGESLDQVKKRQLVALSRPA